jgi:hypothetical protein
MGTGVWYGRTPFVSLIETCGNDHYISKEKKICTIHKLTDQLYLDSMENSR